jgi:hypothetical protein
MEWAALPAGPQLLDNLADNARGPRPGCARLVASPNEANRPQPSTPETNPRAATPPSRNEPKGRHSALPKRTESPPRPAPETNPTRAPATHRNEPNRPGPRSPTEATQGPPRGPILMTALDIGPHGGPAEVDRRGHPTAPETNRITSRPAPETNPRAAARPPRNQPNPEGAGCPNEAIGLPRPPPKRTRRVPRPPDATNPIAPGQVPRTKPCRGRNTEG